MKVDLQGIICARRLKKLEEEKMLKFLQKKTQLSAQKFHLKAEVLNGIYAERIGMHYKYGLAESYYTEDFIDKLISFKEK